MAEPLVLVAGSDPLADHGGHESYVRAHARASMAAGFRPHLFCVSREAGCVETVFGVVHRIRPPWRPAPAGRGHRKWFAGLWHPVLASAVERFLRTCPGPHLVHAFGYWGSAAVRAARRLEARGVRVVRLVSAYTVLEHEYRGKWRGTSPVHGWTARLGARIDLLALRGLTLPYERQAYTGATLVLVNYESVRRLLETAFGAGLPIRRMPYAPETAFTHEAEMGGVPGPPPAGLPPGPGPLIVTVSRHDPRKGLDVLLHALARLRGDGVAVRACLVGGWSLLDAHRRLAARLGLGPETVLIGYVPDPYPYLRRADVFALPSLEEASGSVSLLEALQAEVAVVASDVDGIPEDVTDAESALLVPPGDPGRLAGALRRLVEDPSLRARLARAGHATFQARFSAGALTAALRDLYAELGFGPGG